MSNRPDGRIEQGMALSQAISARAWNRAQDAADLVLGGAAGLQPGPAVGPTIRPYTPILVCNRTTGTVDRWGCLSIDGLQVIPTGPTGAATLTFEATPVLKGGLPTAGSPFVVPVEPIAPSGIGWAAVDGVVQCKLDIVSASHEFAAAKDGTLGELKSSSSGEAEILWKESGTGAGKWALIRFGSPGGGGTKIGKFTGTWSKGATASVTEWKGDRSAAVTGPSGPVTLVVHNPWQSVTGPTGGAWAMANIIDTTWTLAAVECNE
jgi:hypothetical protein